MYQDKWKFGQITSGACLNGTDVDTLWNCVNVLVDMESTTAAIGAEKTPILQGKLVVTARVIDHLRQTKPSTPSEILHMSSSPLSS